MDSIQIPDAEAATPQEQCAIAPSAMLTSAQALCVAKVSGLKRGIARWIIREYPDYVDVSNTTSKYPVEKGFGVRIARVGGRVLSIEPWEAVIVR